ncbi:MAG: ABC transporter ATP-binding protein [Candidatus Nanopelagicales bacterium]|nr:ABC transporter ATP-binding protein [Candidatus Nanopelagicales bacterium]MDZ4248961.1 ABC transporter ATP-binding protein [Candidatus Nanopelagicales bacterium]
MTVWEAIRSSLRLLSHRDRRLLAVAAGLQMATSILDLLGVLLFGLVGILAASSVQGSPPPSYVENVANSLGLVDASTDTLTAIAGLTAAALLLLKSGVSILIIRRVLRFLASRCAAVSARLGATLLARPILEVQARPSQEIAYALSAGVIAAISGILGNSVIVITEATLLILLGGALLIVSPLVALAAIGYFALVAILLQRLLGTWAARVGRMVAAADIASTATVQEAINSYREVSVSNRRSFYSDRFRELRQESARGNSDGQFIVQLPKYVLEAALVFGATALAVTQFLMQDAMTAVGTLALFLAAGTRVMPSIMRLQASTTGIRAASGSAETTYALAASLEWATQPEVHSPEPQAIREQIQRESRDLVPNLEVSEVTLNYPGAGAAALHSVSITVDAGSSLALVGATGSGKSTLADVILGVLRPESGSVTIGGLAPEQAVVKWPGGIGYVPQEVALSNGTVRDNVALGLPRAAIDDERVWRALDSAHIAEFLRSSREGLDTRIGEHGVRLSGGQRQRLGIARALYTGPRLLVLDEATSALDAETEQAIAETFESLEGEVTLVTVAHRLATIRHADEVIYLEHGRVLARGTFKEVRRAVPRFDRQAELLGL